MDSRIVPVEPSDDVGLHALLTHPNVADTYGGSPTEQVSAIRARLEGSDPGFVHRLKAMAGDRLIGFATLEAASSFRRRHAGRVSLAVHPEAWRQGVGSKLMAAITDAADRWLGLTRLELDVRSTNEAAIALYRKHGFATEATRKGGDVMGERGPLDALHMARFRPGFTPTAATTAAPAPAEKGPPAEIRIRPVSPADAEAVATMHREESILRGTLQMPTVTAEFWRKRITTNDPAQHRLLVAEHDGRLVGLGGLHGLGNPRFNHIAGLGMTVSTAYQGRGVGRQIMTALLDLADRYLALRRVELEVYPDNDRAIRLYRAGGFVEEGTLRAYAFRDGALADVLLMARVR